MNIASSFNLFISKIYKNDSSKEIEKTSLELLVYSKIDIVGNNWNPIDELHEIFLTPKFSFNCSIARKERKKSNFQSIARQFPK